MFENLRTRILAVIFAGAVLIAIDGSTVSPILEAIQHSFGVNESGITWIFNIEILFLMLATPVMAKLSDHLGRKRIYVLNAVLFLLGTLIVAFSSSFVMLLVGRSLQGIGAVLSVLAITIIGDHFKETRGTVLGAFGVIIALVYAVGPVISGYLVNYGWHWVFLINVPVAAVVALMGYYLLPNDREVEGKRTRMYSKFDWKGMTFLGVAIASIIYFIVNFGKGSILNMVWPLILSFAALAVFWWVEKNTQEPILQINILAKRNVLITSALTLVGYTLMAGTYYLSTFAVTAFGLTYSQGAYVLIPMTIASLLATMGVGKLLDVIGSKHIMITGGVIATIGMIVLSFSSSLYMFGFAVTLIGIGNAAIIGNALYYVFLDETGESDRASGQAILNLLLNAGSLLGGAVIGVVIDAGGYGVASFRSIYLYLGIAYILLTFIALGLVSHNVEEDQKSDEFPFKPDVG